MRAIEKDRARRALGPEHWDTLSSMNALAIASSGLGRYDEAAALYREVLETDRRVLGPEHPETLNTMYNLVLPLAHLGRYEEAESVSRAVIDAQRRVLGPEHPKTLRSIYNLACLAAVQGSRAEALDALREAVAHGFSNVKLLLGDSDLASLRGDAGFEKLVAAARENHARKPR